MFCSTGELCACRATPEPAAAAAAAAELRAAPSQAVTATAATFVYCRVVADSRPAVGAPLYRISVEVLPGVYADMLSTELFSFRGGATRQAGDGGVGIEPVSPNRSMTGGGGAQLSASGMSVAGNGMPAGNTRNGSGAVSSMGTGKEGAEVEAGSGGAVGPAEVAIAVRQMLVAAGLPEDLASGQLLEQSLVLKSELLVANERLGVLQKVRSIIPNSTALRVVILGVRKDDSRMLILGHPISRNSKELVSILLPQASDTYRMTGLHDRFLCLGDMASQISP